MKNPILTCCNAAMGGFSLAMSYCFSADGHATLAFIQAVVAVANFIIVAVRIAQAETAEAR